MFVSISLLDKTMTISRYITVTDKRKNYDSLYCCVKPSLDHDYQKLKQDVCAHIDANELKNEPHITIVYSKKAPTQSLPEKFLITDKATISDIEYWEGHDKIGYIVAKLKSDSLTNANKALIDCGCEAATYKNYSPHLTLATHVGALTDSVQEKIKKLKYIIGTGVNFDSIEYDDLKD